MSGAGEAEEEGTHFEISALEAESYVDSLEPLQLEQYCSPKWLRQHEALEKLNLQAHFNIIHTTVYIVKKGPLDGCYGTVVARAEDCKTQVAEL